MSKSLDEQLTNIRNKEGKICFSLGTITLVSFCTFLIVIATFTQLSFFHYSFPITSIFHPSQIFSSEHLLKTSPCEYIPQIPVIVYIAALLGPIYGTISVLLYIILGLSFFPIFALGGGIKYFLKYNFGYILAYIPAIFVVSYNLKKNSSYKDIAKASLFGILTIHIVGLIYASIMMTVIKREPIQFILEWIMSESITKFIYDLIFSFLAIMAAKLTKKMLKIILS